MTNTSSGCLKMRDIFDDCAPFPLDDEEWDLSRCIVLQNEDIIKIIAEGIKHNKGSIKTTRKDINKYCIGIMKLLRVGSLQKRNV